MFYMPMTSDCCFVRAVKLVNRKGKGVITEACVRNVGCYSTKLTLRVAWTLIAQT